MEGLVVLLLLTVLGAFVLVPIVVFSRLGSLGRRIERLESEVARLTYLSRRSVIDLGDAGEPAVAAPAAVRPEAARTPATAPAATPPAVSVPEPGPRAAAWPPPQPGPTPPGPTPPVPAPPVPRPPAPGPRAPEPARPALDAARLEELVGGVWLQNLGSVVLLLGVFLMIVWGYTTGRFGPLFLVVGGVLFGLALAWRGDRVAHRTPAFGHALIGVGLGVVYLTLYLGFVRLHVLNAPTALALLVGVSVAAIAAGLRYRVQAIAAFGVVGAFLPQFMARWLGLPGFEVSPPLLLGYVAAIDLVVFALAARTGWSGLDLLAIALSAFTWTIVFPRPSWGWGAQVGLSGLFTVLALAPLPRLVKAEGRLRPSDLAVVAIAPIAMLAASAPFLSWANRTPVAMLLFSTALVFVLAALWVDTRRPERDLWVPLTAAATLFVTAGLERALGPVYTWLAWTLEGFLLVLLGLAPRAGWLRAMGHVVLALGAGLLFLRDVEALVGAGSGRVPCLSAEAERQLAGIALFVATGAVLARRRDRLVSAERVLPELWTLAGHAFLAFWLGTEANRFAADVHRPGGRFAVPPPAVGTGSGARADELGWTLAAAAWLAQALALAWRGARAPIVSRAVSLLLGAAALLACVAIGDVGWWTDRLPLLNAVSFTRLAAVALMVTIALRHAPRPGGRTPVEWVTARAWAAAASLLLMLWSVREMRHLAIAIAQPAYPEPVPGRRELLPGERALAAALASVAWLAQAVLSLVAGWLRNSAFLRWCGLALMGLTLLKFLVFDLQTVDVFWRFLTAIVVGAAMLAFSYAYQRRAKAAR